MSAFATQGFGPGSGSPSPTVLLVDDERIALTTLAPLLGDTFEVRIAECADDARQLFDSAPCDSAAPRDSPLIHCL